MELTANRCHATPISQVGKSGKDEIFFKVDDYEEYTVDEYREKKKKDGWRVQYTELGGTVFIYIWGWVLKLILFGICFVIPLIGTIVPLWMAISKFVRKSVTMYKHEEETIQCYKGGYRHVGYGMRKNEIKIPANKRDRKIFTIYGFIYLAIFIGFVVRDVSFIRFYKAQEQKTEIERIANDSVNP